jgi:hypothetical protein
MLPFQGTDVVYIREPNAIALSCIVLPFQAGMVGMLSPQRLKAFNYTARGNTRERKISHAP